MADFTVTKLGSYEDKIKDKVASFTMHCNDIIININNMQRIIRSEDSELANTLRTLGDSYASYQGSIINNFNQLLGKMEDYRIKTIRNEENASQEIVQINGAIDSILLSLKTIPTRN